MIPRGGIGRAPGPVGPRSASWGEHGLKRGVKPAVLAISLIHQHLAFVIK